MLVAVNSLQTEKTHAADQACSQVSSAVLEESVLVIALLSTLVSLIRLVDSTVLVSVSTFDKRLSNIH